MQARYSKDHQYVTVEDGVGTVGITEHGQEKLSYVTSVELPRVGEQVKTSARTKGLASYYDIADARRAARGYQNAWTEVARIFGLVSFEPDKVPVHIDGVQLKLEPGQGVIERGIDRDLTVEEMADRSGTAIKAP
jgi:hypothetical protein